MTEVLFVVQVLGREVYTSNNQLGGIQIMHNNGVTHTTVSDDFEGVFTILQWLSYMPKVCVECVFFCVCVCGLLQQLVSTPELIVLFLTEQRVAGACCIGDGPSGQRDWIYSNQSTIWPSLDAGWKTPPQWALSKAFNPENVIFVYFGPDQLTLLCAAVRGTWQSGFFDHGSFMEIMESWAQTVVVGRARLDFQIKKKNQNTHNKNLSDCKVFVKSFHVKLSFQIRRNSPRRHCRGNALCWVNSPGRSSEPGLWIQSECFLGVWLKLIVSHFLTSTLNLSRVDLRSCSRPARCGSQIQPSKPLKRFLTSTGSACLSWCLPTGGAFPEEWKATIKKTSLFSFHLPYRKYYIFKHASFLLILRHVWPDFEVWRIHCGHPARFPPASASLHPATSWIERRIMGCDRPHHQPTVYGALCRQGEQVRYNVLAQRC